MGLKTSKNNAKTTQKQREIGRISRAGGELALISALRARDQRPLGAIRLGIGDDCALIRLKPGEDVAVTTDFSLENVHFRRDWHTPESVGHRCLARGLSDLAAMGARPVAAFLSLAVPRELTIARLGQRSWMERFLDGLLALADKMDVPLAGGDTAESPAVGDRAGLVVADIVLLGGVKRGRALLRSGARAGDLIYVTGALGGAAAELLALERNPAKFQNLKAAADKHPHLYPHPRVGVGRKLAERRLATGCIDLSDGLSTDLRHLCEESGLSAEIDAAALPVHPMARLAEAAGWVPSAMDLALHGGEDYELLFTASPKTKLPRRIGGIAISPIGRTMRTHGELPAVQIRMHGGEKRLMDAQGWEHFRR